MRDNETMAVAGHSRPSGDASSPCVGGEGRVSSRSLDTVAAAVGRQSGARLSASARVAAGLVGVVLCVPLGVAWRLEPSPLGMGTHQQLGLPPCTFRLLLGIRCPSCGMTTSWSHLVRGQVVSAVRCSVCGTVLAGLCATAAAASLLSAVRGRWVVARPTDAACVWGVAGLVLLMLGEWLCRLVAG
jgi:hypothetical protein